MAVAYAYNLVGVHCPNNDIHNVNLGENSIASCLTDYLKLKYETVKSVGEKKIEYEF